MPWDALSGDIGDRHGISSVGLATRLSAALVIMTCLLLAGCGGQPHLVAPESTTPFPAASASPAASPAATPATGTDAAPLGEIVWAESVDPATSAPQGAASAFSMQAPRIAAAVLVHELPAGATITASWEYNRTSLDAFTTELVLPEPLAEQWLSFHLDRDPGMQWPEGEYAITISLDGKEMERATIAVVAEN